MITVGFTYDLRDDYIACGFSQEASAEFDSVVTIDAIAHALEANGFALERIGNVKDLVGALAAGRRWDIVFNICEGVRGVGREAQVPALLDAFAIPHVFSATETMVLTMDKALAKRVVRDHGIPTPEFAVVRESRDLASVTLDGRLFVKPLAEGTGKGISGRSLVTGRRSLAAACREIIARFGQPALVERFLPGRDLTVGILGSGRDARAIGVLEAFSLAGAEPGGQSWYNKENCEQVMDYRLADDPVARRAAKVAVESWRTLGCFDAGRVDLRCDDQGQPHFLEVNPLAGLHPTHSDLPMLARLAGIDYGCLVRAIMDAALRRHGLDRAAVSRVA